MAIEYVDIDLTSEPNTNARVKEFVNKTFKAFWADYDGCPDYDGTWRWLAKRSLDTSNETYIGLHIGPGNGYSESETSTTLTVLNCGVYPIYKEWVNNPRCVWDLSNGDRVEFGINSLCELPYLRAYKLKDGFYLFSKFASTTDRENDCGQPIMIFGIDTDDSFGFGYMYTTDKNIYQTYGFHQLHMKYGSGSNQWTETFPPNYGVTNYHWMYELGNQKIAMISEKLTRFRPYASGSRSNNLWDKPPIEFDNLKVVISSSMQLAQGNKYLIDGKQYLCLVGSATTSSDWWVSQTIPDKLALLIKCE